VECTVDNVFNLRYLVLQELVKIIVVCCIKNLSLKFKRGNHFIYPTNVLNFIKRRD